MRIWPIHKLDFPFIHLFFFFIIPISKTFYIFSIISISLTKLSNETRNWNIIQLFLFQACGKSTAISIKKKNWIGNQSFELSRKRTRSSFYISPSLFIWIFMNERLYVERYNAWHFVARHYYLLFFFCRSDLIYTKHCDVMNLTNNNDLGTLGQGDG